MLPEHDRTGPRLPEEVRADHLWQLLTEELPDRPRHLGGAACFGVTRHERFRVEGLVVLWLLDRQDGVERRPRVVAAGERGGPADHDQPTAELDVGRKPREVCREA